MFGFMVRAFFMGMSVKKVDVVWATSPTVFQAFAATLVAKFKRKPLILEIRDIWPDALVDIGALRNKLAIALSRKLVQWMYTQARFIVINSPGFRAHLVASGIPDAKISLVANGVDVSMFDPHATGEETRIRLGWEGKFVALYSGAHGMANDLETLLKAAQTLSDCPQALIAFLGDGPEKAHLQVHAQELGLRNVQFLASIPKADMPELLAASNACIAHLKPSAMQAMVYPNKVFDYMAAARPTILGIGGVIRDVIEKAGGGVCTAPGDALGLAAAIRRLAESPEECKDMGHRARTYVEAHFQRQAMGDALLTIIARLPGGNGVC
jgi:glycosyltransferase involved in cell wall biosynthesis